MSEMYWITRFEDINTICGIIGLLSMMAGSLLLIAYLIQKQNVIEGKYNYAEEKKLSETLRECKNWSLSIGIVFTLIDMFIPTTKEAMLIWGVGSTIDYIKTNDKVQQLPDKCIDAWVESLNEEKK